MSTKDFCHRSWSPRSSNLTSVSSAVHSEMKIMFPIQHKHISSMAVWNGNRISHTFFRSLTQLSNSHYNFIIYICVYLPNYCQFTSVVLGSLLHIRFYSLPMHASKIHLNSCVGISVINLKYIKTFIIFAWYISFIIYMECFCLFKLTQGSFL